MRYKSWRKQGEEIVGVQPKTTDSRLNAMRKDVIAVNDKSGMNLYQKAVRRKRNGLTLVEVVIAAFIFLLMALMFAAVVPASLRSVRTGTYYSLASQIAQKKLDQLMDPNVGYKKLTITDLRAAGIISAAPGSSSDPCEYFDPNATSSGTLGNENYTLTAYFTDVDKIRLWKNDGSDACSARTVENALPGDDAVLGKLELTGWEGRTAADTNARLMQATVTITWKTNGQGVSSYTETTLIPNSTIL